MHLTLHLTSACNMRCSYCYAPPRSGPAMSEQVGRKALELGSGLSCGSCGIIFFGGEPLLHKDLIQTLVLYGRDMERRQAGRFHFKITTNGLLLDERFLSFAVRHDMLVAISFDGIKEAHDRHRRLRSGEPSYDVLLARLRRWWSTRIRRSIWRNPSRFCSIFPVAILSYP